MLYGHVFRNAMLIVIAGFPAAFVAILFTSSLLIEVIFSLNGMGLLSYEAVIKRDYPILLGTVFIFSLVGPRDAPRRRPHLCAGGPPHRLRDALRRHR